LHLQQFCFIFFMLYSIIDVIGTFIIKMDKLRQKMVDNITTKPVANSNFFNWEVLIDFIWDKLRKDFVLLEVPMRFGKTSIMQNIYQNPRYGYNTFYLDLKDIREPIYFIKKIIYGLINLGVIPKYFRYKSKLKSEGGPQCLDRNRGKIS